jgi:hypothetical protein
MACVLAHGPAALAAAKTVMVVCPLAVLEWCRTRRPTFTRHAMRLGLAAYVAVLAGGYLIQPALEAARPRVMPAATIVRPPTSPPAGTPASTADVLGPS